MTFQFKPAQPSSRPMSIGLAGPGGSGKTYTALILAKALANGGPVAMIDTESGRGAAYTADFDYLYTEFAPPFTPDRYIEAMKDAVKAGAKAIIVDSASHEWEGEGGVLEAVEARARKGDHLKPVAWAENKPKHRAFVYYGARGPVHTIFCVRAREKSIVEKVWKDGKEKTVFTPVGWQPCSNEEANFEFTLFAMLDPIKVGVPMAHEKHKFIKYLADQWKPGQQITPEIAAKIAAWANGTQKPAKAPSASNTASVQSDTQNGATGSEGAAVRQQMGIEHEQAPFEENLPDMDVLPEYDPADMKRSRQLRAKIAKIHTMDGVSDLDGMVVDMRGLIPNDHWLTLRDELHAKSQEILEAERAA